MLFVNIRFVNLTIVFHLNAFIFSKQIQHFTPNYACKIEVLFAV